jgi:hypothetical protein
VAQLGSLVLRDSTASGQKKIFAIVTPPMPADVGDKMIRRILIFDNHPDSLRLVSRLRVRPDVDPATPRHRRFSYVAIGLVVITTLVLAMIWPLL